MTNFEHYADCEAVVHAFRELCRNSICSTCPLREGEGASNPGEGVMHDCGIRFMYAEYTGHSTSIPTWLKPGCIIRPSGTRGAANIRVVKSVKVLPGDMLDIRFKPVPGLVRAQSVNPNKLLTGIKGFLVNYVRLVPGPEYGAR